MDRRFILRRMTRHRPHSDPSRIAGFTPQTLWRLVRSVVRGLSVLHMVARVLPAGRMRSGLLRELGQGLGVIETMVRCLLLMMRTPAGAMAPACFRRVSGVPAADEERLALAAGTLPAPRFSLHMKEIARPAGQGASPRPAGQSKPAGTGPRPADQLACRLAALRQALARPGVEAARMAAYMMARGYRRRAPKPLRPWAGFGPARRLAMACPPVTATRTPDTS